MKRIFAYLRASTADQDAERAKAELVSFADQQGFKISAYFTESESGATLKRPELLRMLDIMQHGDVLLIESVDRLTRLDAEQWEGLKAMVSSKGLHICCLDVPTTHAVLKNAGSSDDFESRIFQAISAMVLDIAAAMARKDYTLRRKRQSQGIEKAKAEGKFKGRKKDILKRKKILKLRSNGLSYSEIQATLGVSSRTVALAIKDAI